MCGMTSRFGAGSCGARSTRLAWRCRSRNLIGWCFVAGEIISVVGAGWSVSQIDLSRIPGEIIAINDSAVHLPRFDIVVSMDRLWTEHRYEWMRKMQKPARI